MDITTLVPEFNQYTLIQRKLFLDWILLPIENDEEARNRFLESLLNDFNDSNIEVEVNEIEGKLDLLIKRIEKKEKIRLAIAGPRIINTILQEVKCRIGCKLHKDQSKYKICIKDCKSPL
ncbi:MULTISPECIES: hypothetical protein [unclassified Nodularia (in: cyanobacteria)]|uniref:hypothetical protein n=1 Tax=unclassified Nodularia (in: cyanobacteria) TaxID=2656917 RepID=UPI001880F29C|nr:MULTISPECIES: hypothetical protein [unclassified Nodularia (in: cyanobacteria)]MBE9201395.1 hypothetical protein [Nodularia sp. LEGE 06071]MCC2691521.1 hypothetical protein [Nodularia sp. LEGE 04288]